MKSEKLEANKLEAVIMTQGASQVALVVKIYVSCQYRRRKRLGFDPWLGKIPWRRAWQPTPVFFPGESHAQRCLMDYRPQDSKVRHN